MFPRVGLSLVAQACFLISPNWVDSAALLSSVSSQLRVCSSPVLTPDNLLSSSAPLECSLA